MHDLRSPNIRRTAMRKRLKVSMACDTCRSRKVKCNGARPGASLFRIQCEHEKGDESNDNNQFVMCVIKDQTSLLCALMEMKEADGYQISDPGSARWAARSPPTRSCHNPVHRTLPHQWPRRLLLMQMELRPSNLVLVI